MQPTGEVHRHYYLIGHAVLLIVYSFDCGVYFEANGHGTVLFSHKFAKKVATAVAGNDVRRTIAIRRLKVCFIAYNVDILTSGC